MIEEFSAESIQRFLRASDLRFLFNQDGNFVLDFCGDDVPDYRVQLSIEGPDRDILGIRIGTDIAYPENLRGLVEAFIGGWNGRTRWPKAYLVDDSRGRGIRVLAENCFPLGPGIHPELLEHFIYLTMFTGRQLIEELTGAVSVARDSELQRWLREAG